VETWELRKISYFGMAHTKMRDAVAIAKAAAKSRYIQL
jgi:hypothetical protein